jgi:hypothetical protein
MEGKSSQIKLLMAYTIYMIPIADTLLAKSHYCLPSNGSTVSSSIQFTFSGTDNNNIAGFECSIDNLPFSTCNSPVILNNLASGVQHNFQVRAIDTSGNKDPTPASFTWTILTPQQAVQKLINTIDSMNLGKGTTNILEYPLRLTSIFLNIHHTNLASCHSLNTFLDVFIVYSLPLHYIV